MNQNTQARLIAAVAIGIVLGLVLHFHMSAEIHETRAQFLAAQGIRYDRLLMGSNSVVFMIIAAAALVCLAAGTYELVVALVKKLVSLFQGTGRGQGGQAP